MKSIFRSVPALALLWAPALASAAPADDMAPFRVLVGPWTCAGTFASNGKPIAATVTVVWDEPTASIMVRHDDLAPNRFHALEVWGKAKDGGFRASIADAYSGVRWLTSPGWTGGALDWTRAEGGAPVERFRYSDVSAQGFEVEWFVFGKDGQPRLGDSLRCRPKP
jgi:hypothetical protein